ncbi:MAG: DUF3847 domain-containing protein [Clostridiales bacterium]|nr:DUF3847 domain-containing protein [Clostridiales bacterium]
MKKKEQPHTNLADAERQLKQAQHRLQREENKKAYQRSKKEKERAHRLITRGAEIEHFFPEIKYLTETEFYDLAEMLHDIPAVKALFQERAALHVDPHPEKEAG